MFDSNDRIRGYDDELAAAINAERVRQEEHIELIASENYASPRVMEAQGSVLTNKYAEGYPHKRYYGGCEYVDKAEELAIARACELFGADYANVQPHSGSQANAAVYLALLKPGDTILGMSLDAGGHLTHGAAPNFSGKTYNAVQYGLNNDTGEVDYDEIAALAEEGVLERYYADADEDGFGDPDPETVTEIGHLDDDRLFIKGAKRNAVNHVLVGTGHKTLLGQNIVVQHAETSTRRHRHHAAQASWRGGLCNARPPIEAVHQRPAPDIDHRPHGLWSLHIP